jgi:hypothetical protein
MILPKSGSLLPQTSSGMLPIDTPTQRPTRNFASVQA